MRKLLSTVNGHAVLLLLKMKTVKLMLTEGFYSFPLLELKKFSNFVKLQFSFTVSLCFPFYKKRNALKVRNLRGRVEAIISESVITNL